MMKSLATLLTLVTAVVSYGNVSISFSQFNDWTVLADPSGTPQDGMSWALIVDTAGDGIDSVTAGVGYDPFDINTSSTFLSLGGAQTDDYYTFGESLGTTINFIGQTGTVGQASNLLDSTQDSNLAGTPSYGLIWFPSNSAGAGDSYGTAFDPSVTFPSGASPLVPEYGYADTTWTATQTIVPEPAHYAALLGLLGLAFVMWRRRR